MDRTEWALGIADAVAAGAKCKRRQVGCVILNDDGTPVSFGKNGSPPGTPECSDGFCPRGNLSKEECLPGAGYDNCIGDHAERNAIAFAPKGIDWAKVELYCSSEPCVKCRTLIEACGIEVVKWKA
jgi:dCMP deaminase